MTYRRIYRSHTTRLGLDDPVIADFDTSRLGEPGQKHTGQVMPDAYRAPKIIMHAEWGDKIDMWAFGVMVCCGADPGSSVVYTSIRTNSGGIDLGST